MTLKQHLPIEVHDLAENIRRYTREQAPLWRQVPNLALEANGRLGWNDHYRYCITSGYWYLTGSYDLIRNQSIYVDCMTGELVGLSPLDIHEPILDFAVLRLAVDLSLIDAERVIVGLNQTISKPYPSSADLNRIIAHNAHLRIEHALSYLKPYTRALEPNPITT